MDEAEVWIQTSEGTRWPIRGTCAIGRSKSNDIIINDGKVSRRHVLIHKQDDAEYWIIDLGFRSATVKFAAHYRTLNDPERINEIVNTALFYSSCVGPVLLLTNYLLAPHLASWMHISHPLFPQLIMIVLSAWILGSLFNVFFGCLEGFQRFDLLNKINQTLHSESGALIPLRRVQEAAS